MKWAHENHRTSLDVLVKSYGADALILELARRAEANVSSDDPAGSAIVQTYAADLRRALRRRDESHALVSYRRDWPTDQWVRWLASEAERDELTLRSQWAAALRRAGCAHPDVPADQYAYHLQEQAIADRGSRLPASDEQWASYVCARSAEVAKAKGARELAAWIISQGYPGKMLHAHRFLFEQREQLPAAIRPHIPQRKRDKAEESQPSKPTDPNDTSMFTLGDGDPPPVP
jgi:hypothetical protein